MSSEQRKILKTCKDIHKEIGWLSLCVDGFTSNAINEKTHVMDLKVLKDVLKKVKTLNKNIRRTL